MLAYRLRRLQESLLDIDNHTIPTLPLLSFFDNSSSRCNILLSQATRNPPQAGQWEEFFQWLKEKHFNTIFNIQKTIVEKKT